MGGHNLEKDSIKRRAVYKYIRSLSNMKTGCLFVYVIKYETRT